MNAILLAAGMGSRLRPLTDKVPKAMVPVNGEPVIERQIKFFKEKGIDDFIIVTGYLHENFNAIQEKYSNIKLVHNDKFEKYNNIYSLYLALEYLNESYIVETDVYMARNFIRQTHLSSAYYVRYQRYNSNEWGITLDGETIKHIFITDKPNYILSGISFWTKEDSKKLKELVCKYISKGAFKNLFWDDVVKDNLQEFDLKAVVLGDDDSREIDTKQDIEYIMENILISNKTLR